MKNDNAFVPLLTLLFILVIGGFFLSSLPFGSIERSSEAMNNNLEIPLPEAQKSSRVSIEEALNQRRSVREYSDEGLTLEEVAQLLWAAQGITSMDGRKTAPSAGATYPLEAYVVVRNVEDLNSGVYRYISQNHALVKVVDGDKSADLRDVALAQDSIRSAPVNIVLAAVYERTSARYGARGERFVHMEAGHAAQNIYLQCESLNLGTVVVGAFDDEEVKRVLNLPDEENPLYIIPIGRKNLLDR